MNEGTENMGKPLDGHRRKGCPIDTIHCILRVLRFFAWRHCGGYIAQYDLMVTAPHYLVVIEVPYGVWTCWGLTGTRPRW